MFSQIEFKEQPPQPSAFLNRVHTTTVLLNGAHIQNNVSRECNEYQLKEVKYE